MDIMNKVETTLFTETIGNSPTARVLELLINGEGLDYSLSDIVEGAEVSWATVHEVVPQLEKKGLIKHTRKVGMAKMYKINRANPVAKSLIDLFFKVLNYNFEAVAAKERAVEVKKY